MNSNWSYSPETPNLGQIRWFLEPCDLEIWRMTLQNNRAPLLCYFKLCSSFHTHWWFQISVTVWKRSIRAKTTIFWAVWPWNLMDDLQKLHVWHCLLDVYTKFRIDISKHVQTRQIWGIWKLRPAYSRETPNLGQNRWCFVPCDLEIWWMTLENNRAPLLCCFKLCATFHSHRWIQTGVAVRKRPIWVKFDDF